MLSLQVNEALDLTWEAARRMARQVPAWHPYGSAPGQTLFRLYIWWRNFWVSSSVDASMAAIWHDSRAYAGGPRGSHEYIIRLLTGSVCTCAASQHSR